MIFKTFQISGGKQNTAWEDLKSLCADGLKTSYYLHTEVRQRQNAALACMHTTKEKLASEYFLGSMLASSRENGVQYKYLKAAIPSRCSFWLRPMHVRARFLGCCCGIDRPRSCPPWSGVAGVGATAPLAWSSPDSCTSFHSCYSPFSSWRVGRLSEV